MSDALTDDQIRFVHSCLRQWDATARLAGVDSHIGQGLANIEHSSLLTRLLRGGKALDHPPPRSFSYPWYRLVEDGGENGCEVWVDDWQGERRVVINQAVWDLLDEQPDRITASWPATGLIVICHRNAERRPPMMWDVRVVPVCGASGREPTP